MDRYYSSETTQEKPFSDAFLTGYIAFFIATKNSEHFRYLRLTDVKNRYLRNSYTRKEILQKEFDIRKATGY